MSDLIHQSLSQSGGKVTFWKNGEDDKWWWHLKASNGRIIASSDNGYLRKSGVIKSFESVRKFAILALASVEE